jgi:hypothetical protein
VISEWAAFRSGHVYCGYLVMLSFSIKFCQNPSLHCCEFVIPAWFLICLIKFPYLPVLEEDRGSIQLCKVCEQLPKLLRLNSAGAKPSFWTTKQRFTTDWAFMEMFKNELAILIKLHIAK